MKAKDLMIGDWVCYSEPNNYYTKVEEIRCTSDGEEYYIRCHRDSKDTFLEQLKYEDFSVDILRPIPLTPKILEKNGFEKSYSNILTADGYKKLPQYKYKNMAQVQDICRNLITISYSDLEGGVYDIQCGIGSHIYDLKYVHQLQHALRLCGTNKYLKL